jgi:hypothetical protein
MIFKFPGVARLPDRNLRVGKRKAMNVHVVISAQDFPEQISSTKAVVGEVV